MKRLVLLLITVTCFAQDKNVEVAFINKSDLAAWNTKGLPLGTNVTTELFGVTNTLVLLIPSNAIPALEAQGRLTNKNGTIEPVKGK